MKARVFDEGPARTFAEAVSALQRFAAGHALTGSRFFAIGA